MAHTNRSPTGLKIFTFLVINFVLLSTFTYSAPLQESVDIQEFSEGCYYNYNHYNEGDRISTNEPCLNCTCHNKMLMCYLRVCPFTKPIGHDCVVEKREDQCCPIITCPEVPVELNHQTEPGTELAIPEKYGCTIDNKFYVEGAQVPSNPNKPCELCYCIKNRTSCLMQECTLHIDGCQPIYNKDSCCPIRYNCDHENELIEDSSVTTIRPTEGYLLTTVSSILTAECYHDNQTYPDGSSIKTKNSCENCYCMHGDIVCAVQKCEIPPMEIEGKVCKAGELLEGECCPTNYICEDLNTKDKIDINSESLNKISQEDEKLQKHIDEDEQTGEDDTKGKEDSISTTIPTIIDKSDKYEPTTESQEIEIKTETNTILNKIDDTPKEDLNEQLIEDIPLSIPGEGSCLIDGETYTNNTRVPTSNECEEYCICLSSVVTCKPVECSPPKSENCIIDSDNQFECCPVYICENNENKTEQFIENITEKQIDSQEENGVTTPSVESNNIQPLSIDNKILENTTDLLIEAATTLNYNDVHLSSTEPNKDLTIEENVTIKSTVEKESESNIDKQEYTTTTESGTNNLENDINEGSGFNEEISKDDNIVPQTTEYSSLKPSYQTNKTADYNNLESATLPFLSDKKLEIPSTDSITLLDFDDSIITTTTDRITILYPISPSENSENSNKEITATTATTPDYSTDNSYLLNEKDQQLYLPPHKINDVLLNHTIDLENEEVTSKNIDLDNELLKTTMQPEYIIPTEIPTSKTTSKEFLDEFDSTTQSSYDQQNVQASTEILDSSKSDKVENQTETINKYPSSDNLFVENPEISNVDNEKESTEIYPNYSKIKEEFENDKQETNDNQFITTTYKSIEKELYLTTPTANILDSKPEENINAFSNKFSNINDDEKKEVSSGDYTTETLFDLNKEQEITTVSTINESSSTEKSSILNTVEGDINITTPKIDSHLIDESHKAPEENVNIHSEVKFDSDLQQTTTSPELNSNEFISTTQDYYSNYNKQDIRTSTEKLDSSESSHTTAIPVIDKQIETTKGYPNSDNLFIEEVVATTVNSIVDFTDNGILMENVNRIQNVNDSIEETNDESTDITEVITEDINKSEEFVDLYKDKSKSTTESNTIVELSDIKINQPTTLTENLIENEVFDQTTYNPNNSDSSSDGSTLVIPNKKTPNVDNEKEEKITVENIPNIDHNEGEETTISLIKSEENITENSLNLNNEQDFTTILASNENVSTEKSIASSTLEMQESDFGATTPEADYELDIKENQSKKPSSNNDNYNSNEESTSSESSVDHTNEIQTTTDYSEVKKEIPASSNDIKQPAVEIDFTTMDYKNFDNQVINESTEKSDPTQFNDSTSPSVLEQDNTLSNSDNLYIQEIDVTTIKPISSSHENEIPSDNSDKQHTNTAEDGNSYDSDDKEIISTTSTSKIITHDESDDLKIISTTIIDNLTKEESSAQTTTNPSNLEYSVDSSEMITTPWNKLSIIESIDEKETVTTSKISEAYTTPSNLEQEQELATVSSSNENPNSTEQSVILDVHEADVISTTSNPDFTYNSVSSVENKAKPFNKVDSNEIRTESTEEPTTISEINTKIPDYLNEKLKPETSNEPDLSASENPNEGVQIHKFEIPANTPEEITTKYPHTSNELLDDEEHQNVNEDDSTTHSYSSIIEQSTKKIEVETTSPSINKNDNGVHNDDLAVTIKNEESNKIGEDVLTSTELSIEPSSTSPNSNKIEPNLQDNKEFYSTTSSTLQSTYSTLPQSGMYAPPQYSSYPEDEYTDEDESEIFGPGTCRYGGKLYVSAQQIPRDDPCDFCFCFRSDIICLQQSCPPPISGCREEPIHGFCCPRYECPVSMGTIMNITTSTTTTSTTLPPHFLSHNYHGSASRSGCFINGATYKIGDEITSSSGPCMQCLCGGDGQMKCTPKACSPEPLMRQMVAHAISNKR